MCSINEIISLHFGVLLGYITWLFAVKCYWSNNWRSVTSGVQRSDDDPGATAWLYAPYQILVLSSGVLWSLLLYIRCFQRHNMTSCLRLPTNVLAKFVDAICTLQYSTRTLLTRYCAMCHCNEHQLSALQGRTSEKNSSQRYDQAAHSVRAKISGNKLKHGSRTPCYVSAVHIWNYKSARLPRRIAVEQRRYAAGMADMQCWQFETC